jgi:hypothetical protein
MLHAAAKFAAMFSNTNGANAYFYYFTPRAAEFSKGLLTNWDGNPCTPPDQTDLTLLVGNGDVRSILFPTAGNS